VDEPTHILGARPSEPDCGDPRMSDVLVSFVVPAYNEEALIESCLTAIMGEISRTRCRAEIIVVNNGSTDATRQIASSNPNVKVVDEPQRGLVQARRAGFLVSEGKFIANIDADTILPEGWLRTALAEFARRPDLVALSGPYIHYDLPKGARLIAAGFYRGAYIVHLLSRFLAGSGSVMQGGNFIVSRIALEAAGGFNPDFRFYGEDAELARRLSKVGVVKFTLTLRALSSGRRFAGEGLFKVLLRYSANYLWTHLFKHPFSSTWLDFRHATEARSTLERASNDPLPLEPREAALVRQNSALAKFATIPRSERW
jgi:glycosyltransferase involved in cell wall biosynthesis